MTDAGYVVAGWVATGGVLGAYTWFVRARIKRAAASPPEERPPWS